MARIDNCGAQPAPLGRVRLLPGGSPGFSLGKPQITPAPLARVVPPGGSATVAVHFVPRRPSALTPDGWAPDWAIAVIDAPVLGPVAGFSMRAVARW